MYDYDYILVYNKTTRPYEYESNYTPKTRFIYGEAWDAIRAANTFLELDGVALDIAKIYTDGTIVNENAK